MEVQDRYRFYNNLNFNQMNIFFQRAGNSNFNRIFEVDRCQVDGQQASMHITSVVGHLMQIEFEEQYQKWGSCNPEELFTAPIRKFVRILSFYHS